MSLQKGLKFSTDIILFPLVFLLLIWGVYWMEVRFDIRLTRYGIYPMKFEGLRGVLFSPFLHSGLKHIFNNSVPLFVLSVALFYFYKELSWKVILYGTLLTGIATWIIARPAYHIGASGVVYMLVSFLFFKGVISRQYQLTTLSLVVVFLYGGLLWYLFPIDPKISWEGHSSGFMVGLLLALLLKRSPLQNKKFEWERDDYNPTLDPFMMHFDDFGNFIEKLPESIEEDISEESKWSTHASNAYAQVYYFYQSSQEEE